MVRRRRVRVCVARGVQRDASAAGLDANPPELRSSEGGSPDNALARLHPGQCLAVLLNPILDDEAAPHGVGWAKDLEHFPAGPLAEHSPFVVIAEIRPRIRAQRMLNSLLVNGSEFESDAEETSLCQTPGIARKNIA